MARRRGVRPWIAAALLLIILLVIVVGYRSATTAPVVRKLELQVDGFPAGTAPVRLLLFSDLHVHGPDTPPSRIASIVQQINGLKPDVVIAAGDYDGGDWFGRNYTPEQAIAPLAGLRAPLGVYAVLGNHDTPLGEGRIVQALQRAHVRVLMNQAISVGPLAIGGIDGRLLSGRRAWQARRDRVTEALKRTPGVKLLVMHRPDEFHWSPGWVTLALAGHTHCGQIVLPFVGALVTGSDFGDAYRCGLIREHGNVMVVTGGVGTSKFPIRIGAPPDMWLIEIGGHARSK